MGQQKTAWAKSLANVPPSDNLCTFFCKDSGQLRFANWHRNRGKCLGWREILKESGARFFPSPDLTCPIWGSPSLHIFSFSHSASFSWTEYEACQEDPEISATYCDQQILASKSSMNTYICLLSRSATYTSFIQSYVILRVFTEHCSAIHCKNAPTNISYCSDLVRNITSSKSVDGTLF